MLVEERVYTIHPGKLDYFWECYDRADVRREIVPMLDSLVGYYMIEVGDLNRVVHIWKYQDWAERDRVRNYPFGNQILRDHIKRLGSALKRMDNRILKPVSPDPWCPAAITKLTVEADEVIEERIYDVKPGALPRILAAYDSAEVRAAYGPMFKRLIGYFTTEVGPLNQLTHIWRYPNLAAREAERISAHADPVIAQHIRESIEPFIENMQIRLMRPSPLDYLR